MVNIIRKNGMFFKEIPFNLENAKAIQNGSKRGFCVLDNGVCTHNVRIIATDIKDEGFPIVVAVDCGNESVVSVTDCGISSMNGTLRLYVPTRINTYERFVPNIYQACLVRNSNYDDTEWMIAVCNGFDKYGNPEFFNAQEEEFDCLPLCKATLPLFGKTESWLQHIRNTINDED